MTLEQGLDVVRVDLAGRGYDIIIGPGLLAQSGARLKPLLPRAFVAVVTDETVAQHHLSTLQTSLEETGIKVHVVVLPAGEKTKSFSHLAALCENLLEAGVERKDKIIALGGGVIGDLVGFAAAILRRGVDFIQIPTTLLAMVDSSVGGKTGINAAQGKNLIGAFKQPILVLADTSLLSTLPERQLASGYAEMVKYGLLGDADFFHWLETKAKKILRGDEQARSYAIRKSCLAKAELVMEDETEQGARALLNLGHTFGHALEKATGFSDQLLHGEAVAIGMAQAFLFSERLGLCGSSIADQVIAHLKAVGLPARIKDISGSLPPTQELVAIMKQDKKAEGGKLTFILVRGIGQAFIARDVDEQQVIEFLETDRAR